MKNFPAEQKLCIPLLMIPPFWCTFHYKALVTPICSLFLWIWLLKIPHLCETIWIHIHQEWLRSSFQSRVRSFHQADQNNGGCSISYPGPKALPTYHCLLSEGVLSQWGDLGKEALISGGNHSSTGTEKGTWILSRQTTVCPNNLSPSSSLFVLSGKWYLDQE